MPLSEHEERILADLERQLEDERQPRRARIRRVPATHASPLRRIRFAIAGFVIGFVCLLGITFTLVLGIVGFAMMFAAVVMAGSVLRDAGGETSAADWLREAFGRSRSDA